MCQIIKACGMCDALMPALTTKAIMCICAAIRVGYILQNYSLEFGANFVGSTMSPLWWKESNPCLPIPWHSYLLCSPVRFMYMWHIQSREAKLFCMRVSSKLYIMWCKGLKFVRACVFVCACVCVSTCVFVLVRSMFKHDLVVWMLNTWEGSITVLRV